MFHHTNDNGSILRHIVMKLWKTEDKENILRTFFFKRLTENGLFQNKETPRKRNTKDPRDGNPT